MNRKPLRPNNHPWKSPGLSIIKNRPKPMPFISTQTHLSDVMDAIPAMRLGFSLSTRTMENI